MTLRLTLCNYCVRTSPQISSCSVHRPLDFLFRAASTSGKATTRYQDTLLLPRTQFPLRIPAAQRKEHELALAKRLQFDKLYNFQRSWRRDNPEFILHDGPPYANGDPHVGHAVNKILKDITNRYKLLRGYRINYKPGWDCHGLPIELKTLKEKVQSSGHKASPIEIRNAARKVATDSIAKQKQMFQRWNVMADWNNCYHTYDKDYIQSQLRLFYSLYEKGYVYRCLKPIFWSPSSQSALAEAELEYNHNHESLAVFLSVNLNLNLQDFAKAVGCQVKEDAQTPEMLSKPVEAVIWTTTPWSLPANKAICFNEREKYSVVFKTTSRLDNRILYLIASDQVPLVASNLKQELRVVTEFSGSQLAGLTYNHPWFENTKCPFVHADHVIMDKGTGLVHTAPAHGNDDYVIGLKHNLAIDCFVDDEGNFDSRLGNLSGLSATTAGNAAIVRQLEPKVLHKEKYTHSYPYDWRTKKPVLVKTSMQWFIDTQKLKTLAATGLKEVGIFPKNVQHTMLNQIMGRPFWCISRQRVWGVPIPVLYDEKTGEPLVSSEIIEKACELVDKTGSIDWWWSSPTSELVGEDLAQKFVKGKDIFDIWLDSGLSWHTLDGKVADLYLEGHDQFTGWFQSSLLTSLAIRGIPPYKNILVHGFVVDAESRKMSKSEGNVIDPAMVTDGDGKKSDALGVDALRWWVATQGSADGDNITLSTSFLRSSEECVQKFRSVLRFLVSVVQEDLLETLDMDEIEYEELMYTDQYMLNLLHEFQNSVTGDYEDYRCHRALNKALHFATTEISAHYLTWVKDRLYCDLEDSESRKSALYVLNQIYLTLVKVVAPAIPFLAEESFTHYSAVEESLFKYTWFNLDEKSWDNPNVRAMMDLALEVRTCLNQIIGENNRKQIWVEIICNQKNYQTLQVLHPDKCNSELCDILQVSGVDLQCNDQTTFQINPFGVSHSLNGFSVGVSKTEMMQCARCRRYCCPQGVAICSRCQTVLKRIDHKDHVLHSSQELGDIKERGSGAGGS